MDRFMLRIDSMRMPLMLACFVALYASACGGSTDASSAEPGTETGADAGTGTGTNPAQGSDALMLEACATDIASDAPDFYKRYFRCVNVSIEGADVVISTKSLPPYRTYYYGSASPHFVEFDTSRGPEYRPNPNVLREQSVTLRIPISPTPRAGLIITNELVDGQVNSAFSKNDYKMGSVGVALNGVSMYNGLAAPGDDIAREKYTFDLQQGHPDQRGSYHYHSPSSAPLAVLQRTGLISKTQPGAAEVELFGVMCDGTLVLGCTELDGSAPDATKLDAQNGHAHDVAGADGLLLAGRYHVHLCEKWAAASRIFTPEVQYYDRCAVQ